MIVRLCRRSGKWAEVWLALYDSVSGMVLQVSVGVDVGVGIGVSIGVVMVQHFGIDVGVDMSDVPVGIGVNLIPKILTKPSPNSSLATPTPPSPQKATNHNQQHQHHQHHQHHRHHQRNPSTTTQKLKNQVVSGEE